jgi:hypothetical protein
VDVVKNIDMEKQELVQTIRNAIKELNSFCPNQEMALLQLEAASEELKNILGMNENRERNVEAYFKKQVEKKRGKMRTPRAVKMGRVYWNGFPDRLALFPNRISYLVELKAKGKKPRANQVACHNVLAGLGWEVWVLDSKQSVDDFIYMYEVNHL